ncbi:hypothetical protein CASFOL_023747 [Castilleja foliolosa]|uniref:Transcription repressor n=1 Tax=Castilleja foliolosa TaxID=1961234 RepID=A0ABD3CLD4_9LAMI
MGFQNQETKSIKKKYMQMRNSRVGVSFSAKLPGDANVAFRDCICAVKCSMNPIGEIRESILEMIESVGVRNWDQMEELVYCYVALNSNEVHNFIKDAFLSLCFGT